MDETKLEKNSARIKRDCLMCLTYKEFQPNKSDERMKDVRAGLDAFVHEFNREYDDLRARDATVEEISKSKANKTNALDALHTCQQCHKEFDKVNRLLQLK